MKKAVLLFSLLVVSFCAQAQSPLLMTIDNDSIFIDEFDRIYKKNNPNPDLSNKALDEYLELFVNYKLKVKEAYTLGFDTVKSFKKELLLYRHQLAKPYMENKEVTEDLVEEAYQRMKEEVLASHILIRVPEYISSKDTLEAYNKLKNFKKRIEKGESFENLAIKNSEDPSARQSKGDLGWFNCFSMVYPFENAAYSTPVGEVSEPFRTSYGYHILKVRERRKSKGKVKVAHILIREYEKDPEQTRKFNKERIVEIRKKLTEGESFETLVRRYSDDVTTSEKGGVLPVFGIGRMVEEFENAAFSLKKNGDVSGPIHTDYGWHIIKLISKDTLKDFVSEESSIREKITKDSRSSVAKDLFIEQLKKEYNLQSNRKNIQQFVKTSVPMVKLGKINSMALGGTNVLYTWANQTVTQQDVLERLSSNTQPMPEDVKGDEWLSSYALRFAEAKIWDFEKNELVNKYPAYRALLQEYEEGILLFNLTNELVWEKSTSDSAGLATFYERNKNNFMWGDRLNATIYTTEDESVAKKVKAKAKKLNRIDIMAMFNTQSSLTVTADSVVAEIEKDNRLSNIAMKEGVQTYFKGGVYYVVKVHKALPSTYKKITEARGLVTAGYQEELEREWIKSLKEKYSISINKKSLQTLQ
jgi:peptidyl-prolyl cis-trans isomerase SurA